MDADINKPAKTDSTCRTDRVIQRTDENHQEKSPIQAEPYQEATLRVSLRGRELHELSPSEFAKYVREVVEIESPVHLTEVIRRIATSAGLKRAGTRIQEAVSSGIRTAESKGLVRKQGDFLWKPNEDVAKIRDRSNLDASSRKLELIAPEEIAAAAKQVVKSAFSIDRDDALSAVIGLFGFRRTTSNAKSIVEKVVNDCIQNDDFNEREGVLVYS